MILPGSYAVTVVLLVLSMLCWGAWANTLKAAGAKYRYELYYFDFAIGAVLTAVVISLTFGTLGFDGFAFIDEIVSVAGKRQEFFAAISGFVLNLGMMLLVGGIFALGIVTAFPLAIGTALIIRGIFAWLLAGGQNLAPLIAGAIIVLASIVADALAYRTRYLARLLELAEQGRTKSTKKTVRWRGVVISIVGGILIGGFYPLIALARRGENGLGPYSAGFLLAAGVAISTPVYNIFLMNLPVEGEPLRLRAYFRAKWKPHLMGALGGIVWYGGLISEFVASRAEGKAQPGPALAYALTGIGTIIAMLCGLFVWKELSRSSSATRIGVFSTLLLFAAGLALLTLSHAYVNG